MDRDGGRHIREENRERIRKRSRSRSPVKQTHQRRREEREYDSHRTSRYNNSNRNDPFRDNRYRDDERGRETDRNIDVNRKSRHDGPQIEEEDRRRSSEDRRERHSDRSRSRREHNSNMDQKDQKDQKQGRPQTSFHHRPFDIKAYQPKKEDYELPKRKSNYRPIDPNANMPTSMYYMQFSLPPSEYVSVGGMKNGQFVRSSSRKMICFDPDCFVQCSKFHPDPQQKRAIPCPDHIEGTKCIPGCEYLHPLPHPHYLLRCDEDLPKKENKQLLVLDLNGTLLFRNKTTWRAELRPGVEAFLNFVLENFNVMIWSSSERTSARGMIKSLQLDENRLMNGMVWSRDQLGLPGFLRKIKCDTIKDLALLWEMDHYLGYYFDQTNTLLIDDSVGKAVLQPHNHICLKEYVGNSDRDNELERVTEYLKKVKESGNVSYFVKRNPFETGN